MLKLLFTLQIIGNVDGLSEAAQQGPLFAVLVVIILTLASVVVLLYNKNEKKFKKIIELNSEFVNKTEVNLKKEKEELDKIRKENKEELDKIRKEILEREEERNKQWRESERETLNVLNGVNSVLEMGEKMKESDTKILMAKLNELKNSLDNLKNG